MAAHAVVARLGPYADGPPNPFEASLYEQGYQRGDLDLASVAIAVDSNAVGHELARRGGLPASVRWMYCMQGLNDLACKARFGRVMSAVAPGFVPETWVLSDPDSARDLLAQPPGVYVAKTNQQQQRGITLLSDPRAAAAVPGAVVVQRVLLDPLTVGGRKINLRVYVLINVERGTATFRPYGDGFVYYAPEAWDPRRALRPGVTVTTGYIDRRVYETNPLTIGDLAGVLGPERFAVLWRNVRSAVRAIRVAFGEHLVRANAGVHASLFYVVGVDVAPAMDMTVKIMEVNKGPDLRPKDARDGLLKRGVVANALVCSGVTSRTYERCSYDEAV